MGLARCALLALYFGRLPNIVKPATRRLSALCNITPGGQNDA